MIFADIHIHALSGVDDGPKREEEMFEMIAMEYEIGVRFLCLTPHFHPGYFSDNKEESEKVFALLQAHCKEKYPDLVLALGNELRFHPRCVSWLNDGQGRTMNGTKYVLIDFSELESKEIIKKGLDCLLNAGYIPILAHVERYRKLLGDLEFIREYRANGVKIQLDAESLFRGFGIRAKKFCNMILEYRLADFVASDSHSHNNRIPVLDMQKAYAYIEKKCGEAYAKEVCCDNARQMIFNQ